jgi:hypothetical protein
MRRIFCGCFLWLAFISGAVAVTVVPQSFPEAVDSASSILMVRILKAELLEESGRFCGFNYSVEIQDIMKGKSLDRFSFVTSEALWIGGRYVIFLDNVNKSENKQIFLRRTRCKKSNGDWYFWAGVGRIYFSVDEDDASQLGGPVIFINKYNYFRDDRFVSGVAVPEDFKERFSAGWFLYIKDLKDIVKTLEKKYMGSDSID